MAESVKKSRELSVYSRTRRDVRNIQVVHRPNYVASVVDGVVKLTVSEPVVPSLSSEYSVTMNALRNNGNNPLRKRINVDAVDLPTTLFNLQS